MKQSSLSCLDCRNVKAAKVQKMRNRGKFLRKITALAGFRFRKLTPRGTRVHWEADGFPGET